MTIAVDMAVKPQHKQTKQKQTNLHCREYKYANHVISLASHWLKRSHERRYKRVRVSWNIIWAASSEFGTYRLCEQRRFRRACASAQSRQNLRSSLIQAVNQEEPSDRKPGPWPLWMAGHAQLKFVMTECSKTQIRLSGLIWRNTGFVLYL